MDAAPAEPVCTCFGACYRPKNGELGDKPVVGGSSDDRLCPAHREFAMGVGEMTEDEFIGFLKAAMT